MFYRQKEPSEDTVITAWFKKGTVPSNKLDSDAYNLNQLSSFDISLNSENKINYQFTPLFTRKCDK